MLVKIDLIMIKQLIESKIDWPISFPAQSAIERTSEWKSRRTDPSNL